MTWANPVHAEVQFRQARDDAKVREMMQQARAARTVADHSVDVPDCQNLLAMLGLDAAEGKRVMRLS
jgi:hypothetical protein